MSMWIARKHWILYFYSQGCCIVFKKASCFLKVVPRNMNPNLANKFKLAGIRSNKMYTFFSVKDVAAVLN